MVNSPKIRFLGAAQTVTGSKYLLTFANKKILVDCGLFQGLKALRLKNWEAPEVDAKTLDAVVLTHAHVDHSGYIPRLVKEGFRGKVFCTPATLALCRILLPDTGYLLEEEASYLNRKKLSKHDPALPLFTRMEAEDSLKFFVPKNFHEEFAVCEDIIARFLYAGHILGAAMAIVRAGTTTVGFSGDVGRPHDPVLRPPESMPKVDYLIVESTYGNRLHPVSNPEKDIEDAIQTIFARRGVVLIPAFAVGRTQTLLHYIAKLKTQGRIPDLPIYLNSPMAKSATDIFFHFQSMHKLNDQECAQVRDVVRYVVTQDESKALNGRHGPMVIISASGMATGGRILHHLKEFAPDPNNMILLTGYQAPGTRGQALADGAKEIKIHGDFVPVGAEVRSIENLSAHADYQEILDWLRASQISPRKVFVTHGEITAARSLGEKIYTQLGWEFEVPDHHSEFELG